MRHKVRPQEQEEVPPRSYRRSATAITRALVLRALPQLVQVRLVPPPGFPYRWLRIQGGSVGE